VRVNAVAPGWVLTDRQKEHWVTPEALAAHLARQCLPDPIQPDNMAGIVLFLASDASRMMTSQTLILDGGYISS
jgi:NAD(P)-dependent dehydrogenase (short-subunit alcohol dehydrogenase family)